MGKLFTIYRFITRRWDRIKQAARLVAGLGSDLSEELSTHNPKLPAEKESE